MAEADFVAMGWPDAAISERFFVVLAADGALVELETGRNEAVRRALWHFARIEETTETHKQ